MTTLSTRFLKTYLTNIITLTTCVLLSVHVFSQTKTLSRTIDWKFSEQNSKDIFGFKNAHFEPFYSFPVYREKIPITSKMNVSISNKVFSTISDNEASKINLEEVSQEIFFKVIHRKSSLEVVIVPIRINPNSGHLEKLISFNLDIKESKTKNHTNKTFATSSILASGDFYKIGVTQNGLYKIDKGLLELLGIDNANLSFSSLDLFGNSFGRLSFQNDVYRPDDLLENAIQVVDQNNDGDFDDDDYIIFYAKGPHKWSFNGNRFIHEKNFYADTSYFFIGINAGSQKRIQNINSTPSAATHNISTFNDFYFHENDQYNLVGSGRTWYGEAFDVNENRSFNLNFPNAVIGSQAKIEVSGAGRVIGVFNTNETFTTTISGIGSSSTNISGLGSSSSWGKAFSDELDFNVNSSNITVNFNYSLNFPTSAAHLDYFRINILRDLRMSGNSMEFTDISGVGAGNISEYTLSNAGIIDQIWDVSNPTNPKAINYTSSSGNAIFRLPSDSLNTFIAFNNQALESPTPFGKIGNQNLHAIPQKDFIIVSHPLFLDEANELASIRENEGLSSVVVTPQQIYNEFSSGMQDATAIKTFVKMFWDRAAVQGNPPKYLLLFGDGSYNNRNRNILSNSNFIPTYQSNYALNILGSYVSDDFYALLDDTDADGVSSDMEIGVGRLPAQTKSEARILIDKIKTYERLNQSNSAGHNCTNDGSVSFSDWRNTICYVTDDADEAWEKQFMTQCDELGDIVLENYPAYNVDKIYLDAYNQESTPGGERYPEAQERLRQRIERGALMINYIGHGGEVGWTGERLLDLNTIQNFSNLDKLPVFVTATCEFSRYDDPNRKSAGEYLLINADGGSIASLTTTRAVTVTDNYNLNKSLHSYLFEKHPQHLRLGDIYMNGKNSNGNSNNSRRFTLLGDPSLKISLPHQNVITDSINGVHISNSLDTLKALSKISVSGHIEDLSGNFLNNFNGIVSASVFDKKQTLSTLDNDGQGPHNFDIQKNILYKGKASVENGRFSFEFIVPRDIAFQIDSGKISYYAENLEGTLNAHGNFNGILVGGSEYNITDNEGPQLQVFMNDENFVFGGLTDESPNILAKVFDENGINTVGNGIGHDLVAILDENTSHSILLNDYYEADLNTYKSGIINYPLSNLSEGSHKLSLKVWDVNNNSTTEFTEFVVASSETFAINHVLNYPNPFTTRTSFYFEHNKVCNSLDVSLQVFTVSGKLVKSYNKTVSTAGFRSDPIVWDGKDEFGDKLSRGVYVYKLLVQTSDGEKAEKFEKLVILK